MAGFFLSLSLIGLFVYRCVYFQCTAFQMRRLQLITEFAILIRPAGIRG